MITQWQWMEGVGGNRTGNENANVSCSSWCCPDLNRGSHLHTTFLRTHSHLPNIILNKQSPPHRRWETTPTATTNPTPRTFTPTHVNTQAPHTLTNTNTHTGTTTAGMHTPAEREWEEQKHTATSLENRISTTHGIIFRAPHTTTPGHHNLANGKLFV